MSVIDGMTIEQHREQVIRECLNALRASDKYSGNYHPVVSEPGYGNAIKDGVTALEALLPRPDPAKALVEEWKQAGVPQENWPPNGNTWGDVDHFARWLHNEGKLK